MKLIDILRALLLGRATRRELEALDDRMLRDIGLRRDQIRSVARGRRLQSFFNR